MIESYATATDFRNHIAQITNCVAYRQDRCVIMRHGQEVAALVSWEDLEFLRRHKPRKIGPPSVDVFSPKAAWHDHFPEPAAEEPPMEGPADPMDDPMKTIGDPFRMTISEIVPFFNQLAPREGKNLDFDTWVVRARLCLISAGLYPRDGSRPSLPIQVPSG